MSKKEDDSFERPEELNFTIEAVYGPPMGGVAEFRCMLTPSIKFLVSQKNGVQAELLGITIKVPKLTLKDKKLYVRKEDKGKDFLASWIMSAFPDWSHLLETDWLNILGNRGLMFSTGIIQAFDNYKLPQADLNELQRLCFPEIQPEANRYFGNILKRILEDAGYIITIETPGYYFPSPTSAAYLAPAFELGLQKDIEPEEILKGYRDTLIYLSYEKPQTTVQIQLNLLDSIPEERLNNIQKSFKDNLSPYGLKTLYLVIEKYGENNRQPWFVLDPNKCLDLMGYKRKKTGSHQKKNKDRFLQELDSLTKINFNVERREPQKRGSKAKERAVRFTAPLLSVTGKFEIWEVDKGRPIEEGEELQDNIQIFIHPEIYKHVNEGWFTVIPHEFLKIDVRSKPHAILLYSYIANQWRIGWRQYQGTIRQPLRQILEGSGAINSYPKRRNQQRNFVNKIIEDLRWLKGQKEFWIDSVKVERKNRSQLDPMVIITMANDHPLKTNSFANLKLTHLEDKR